MGVKFQQTALLPEAAFIADRHLYLTTDGNTVVEEGDARSASQFVAAGHLVSRLDADRLELVLEDGKVVQRRAEHDAAAQPDGSQAGAIEPAPDAPAEG